ncbi:MAG: radical SAM protein [Planctomycetota bacterium]
MGKQERRGCGGTGGLLLQWHITNRCNLRCAHCYQESYAGQELPYEELVDVIEQFKTLLDVRGDRGHITVTGGEPFVRRDFLDLLERFHENRSRFSFAILTNGSFIDRAMASRLKRLGPSFVQVSVEGAQKTHDRIRGAGDFERTVAALRHLVRARIRSLISFTAHRTNYREFPAVARLGRSLHVRRVWADRLIPSGSGKAMQEQMLTRAETREFFSIMHQERVRAKRAWFGRTEIAMHRALQFLEGGGVPYHCTAGDTLITVMPNGDLYPCRRMPIRVGNVKETPLADLYFGSDLMRALRDPNRISEGCSKCAWSPLCRGGLKCLSYAVTGDPFQADPGCSEATRTSDTVPVGQ